MWRSDGWCLGSPKIWLACRAVLWKSWGGIESNNSSTMWSVQFSSVVQSCPTLCDPMACSMPGFPVHHQLQNLLKLMSIISVMPSNHLILCRSFPLLTSILPNIRVFSNESVLHITWPKYWSFSFSINPSDEYSELTSFRMDWLQSKGLSSVFSNSTVQKCQFFRAQLSLQSNSYIHTWLLEKP